MEIAGGGEEKPPSEAWKKDSVNGAENSGERPKRKMKSPYQLEVLEQSYAADNYPSEALRAELSVKIGLSDRQLQMWFCHRRLKDRKFPPIKSARKEEEAPLQLPAQPQPQPVVHTSEMMMVGSSSLSPFSGSGEPRRAGNRAGAAMRMGGRYYEPMMAPPPMQPQLSLMEMRVINSVEAQLGELLREDGPILGVEFDPLPPGAFGAPIAVAPYRKQPTGSYTGKSFERHEPKVVEASFTHSMEHCYMPSSSSGKRKAAVGGAHVVHPEANSRALYEYQFLSEQPSHRSEAHEKTPQSYFYDSAVVSPTTRVSSLPPGRHYLLGNEPVPPADTYTVKAQLSSNNTMTQRGRQQIFSSSSAEYENAPQSKSFTNSASDTQFGVQPAFGSESPYLPSDGRIIHDEDPSRVERKRKSDEAKIQKEVEAHEKRIRRELEKQDILRKKREEQMRREMERHDRERRKEEERMSREKQREEEKFLREQRRENERKEKFLMKETLRTEKMRQKEKQRRDKEAARLKAAKERATARRIAREYTELIEDERLELMELAASEKGLSSIICLDSEALEQLDIFRDMLSVFPPKSVPLKQPFPNLHWAKEENIGNFLMVWKFLIAFIDVLGLLPFTMDEFLQSLYDYDSKLLGEIHVALLKSIIKDIEDVARTPAVALGANQTSAANPGGGHPQIVEGAYSWGFDIRSWQMHLNLMTWPEILRQFAISAGLGPHLNKRTVEHPYPRDDNEGNNGEDVISTLRSGAAAGSAAALMHERGHRRRSRHRLTPGTVKFAAFHVLSLEGSRGLTILEVADKIQKSGLRDLTTSKTPEASIAAALSRDTKLFERTAPSTYCVRSPFRKDPADADTILSTAREKVHVSQNGLSDLEAEKDADDAEEAERDEGSECDGADDPEVYDASTNVRLVRDAFCSNVLKDFKPISSFHKENNEMISEIQATTGSSLMGANKSSSPPLRKSNLRGFSDVFQSVSSSLNSQDAHDTEISEEDYGETWVRGLSQGNYSDLSVEERLNALVALIGVAIEGNSIRVTLEERLEAANSLKKQMWADAQLDKRRFKEEFINKVQYSSFMGSRAEVSQPNGAVEGSQTPSEIVNNKDSGGNPVTFDNGEFANPQCGSNFNMTADKNLLGQEFSSKPDSLPLQQHVYAMEKSRSQLKSYIGHKAEQHYVYRSLPLGQDRRRNRYWIFSTTSSPNYPGSARIFFESKDGQWRLIDTDEAFDALLAALDTRGVRESHLHSMLQGIEPIFKEAIKRNRKPSKSGNLNKLFVKMGTGATDMSLSPNCHAEIDSPSTRLSGLSSDSVECSGSFKIEFCRNERERIAFLKRYKVFLKWMWKECYNPSIMCATKYGKKRCAELLQTCHLCFHCYTAGERHCPCCHKTFKAIYNVDAIFSEHVSHCEAQQNIQPGWWIVTDSSLIIGIQLLKAQLSLMEASIPAEALQPFWTDGYRKSWGVKLQSLTSAEDMLQLVTLLETAVKRDCLAANYETTNELLGSSTSGFLEANAVISGSTPLLPWVPDTMAAVALRLLDLDASVFYNLQQKLESNKEKDAEDFIKLPSRFTAVKNIQELEPTEMPDRVDYQREMSWLDSGTGRRGRARGTRGRIGRPRGRGGRGLKGNTIYADTEFKEGNVENYGKATRKYTRRGGRTRGRGGRRGRRSVRPRPRSQGRFTVEKDPLLGNFTDVKVNIKQDSFQMSPSGNDWGFEETRSAYVEERRENVFDDDDDDESMGSQSDEKGVVSGDEDDDDDQAGAANYVIDYVQKKPMRMLDDDESEDEEDVNGESDEDDNDGVRIGHGNGHVMMNLDVDEDDDDHGVRIGHGNEHAMVNVDVDDDDDEEEEEEEEEGEIGDDDVGEEIGGDVNGDEGDYSSEYSDSE